MTVSIVVRIIALTIFISSYFLPICIGGINGKDFLGWEYVFNSLDTSVVLIPNLIGLITIVLLFLEHKKWGLYLCITNSFFYFGWFILGLLAYLEHMPLYKFNLDGVYLASYVWATGMLTITYSYYRKSSKLSH